MLLTSKWLCKVGIIIVVFISTNASFYGISHYFTPGEDQFEMFYLGINGTLDLIIKELFLP